MITLALLNLLYYAVFWIFYFVPNVSMDSGVASSVRSAVGGFKAVFDTLPYLEVVWVCFVWLLLFEVAMGLLKFFLGSHTPANIN